MPRATPRTYRLDSAALAQARVSPETPLCLTRSAWGAVFALAASAPGALEKYAETAPVPEGSAVAIVQISGPLSQSADELCGWYDGYEGDDGIVSRFAEAAGDADVGAILLHFDSPGGTSAGLEEAVRRMVEIRDATDKPVIAYVGEHCASAAYWIAATVANAGIYGPIAATVGSIGSYVPHQSIAGMLEQEGIVETLIADPPGKVAGNSSAPLDDLGRARIERMVLACTARFVDAVAAARGLDPEAVRALNGDCMPLQLGITAGLADGLGSLEDVLALAAALAAKPAADAAPRGPMNRSPRSRSARLGSAAAPPRLADGETPPDDEPEFAEGDKVTITSDGAIGTIISADCYEVQVEGEEEPRYCHGSELARDGAPAEAPPADGASARGARPLPRAFARSLVRASGLAASASDAAAHARAADLLGLASEVMRVTGARTTAEALGAVRANSRDAAKLPGVERKLAELAQADEHQARMSLLAGAVAAGKYSRAELFESREGPDGAEVLSPAKGYTAADVSLETLTAQFARAGARTSVKAAKEQPDPNATELATVPANVRAYAALRGLNPEQTAALATLYRTNQAGAVAAPVE